MRRYATLLSVLLLAAGCGGADKVADPEEGEPPSVEEAETFLTTDLPAVYGDLDPDAYGALLHPDFRYVFLDGEAPAEYPAGFWGRTSEEAVMASIFSDSTVTRAVLQIALYDPGAVSLERVTGTDGEWSYRAETSVTEVAFLTAGNDTAGSASYYAFTKMAYELRIDVAADGEWRLYEQTELPPIFGDGPGKAGWGAIKALYYEPLDPPLSRTVKGEVTIDSITTRAGIVVSAGADTAMTDIFGRFHMSGVPGGETSLFIEGEGLSPKTVPIGGGDHIYRVSVDLESLTP